MEHLSLRLEKYKNKGVENYIKQLAKIAREDIKDQAKVGLATMAVLNLGYNLDTITTLYE